MKKITKIYLISLIACFLGVMNVRAGSLSFDGDKTIKGGSTGVNDIVINVGNKEIKAVEFTVSTTNPSLVTMTLEKSASLGGTASLSKTILSPAGEGFLTNGVIATLSIKDNNILTSGTITAIKIENIVFTYSDDTTKEGTSYSKNITLSPSETTTTRVKSSSAKLTSLTLSAGNLSPSFNGSVTSYKVLNLKDTIKNVTITPKCDMCNIKIICELGCTNYTNQNRPELIIGKNTLKIETISEDGNNVSEYDLIIYRGETTDNSAFLEKLEVEDFKISEKFDKESLDYTLTVPNDTTLLNIVATAEDEAATVDIKGADNLQVGENVITITITSSETKDKKIYNITVTRLDIDEVMVTTTKPADESDSEKDDKTLLIIIIAVVSLAIIGLAGYFIFRKKKPKKGKKEKITKDEKIEMPEAKTEVDVKEEDLITDLNITDEKTKPTVDEALADLMTTKEIIFKEE
ncbi:MAG: cadherin-like beta sandwich domain-containing protein [Bacilli bacterium]|nr:cadherin-like beta sandwich domain-containing protein [Bacilli bacterium]